MLVMLSDLSLGQGEQEEARVEAARLGLGRDPASPGDEGVDGELEAAFGERVSEAFSAGAEVFAHAGHVGVGEGPAVHGEDRSFF